MYIRRLEALHYPTPPKAPGQPRCGPESLGILQPSWFQTESAIRRLERDEWPYVWLHTDDQTRDEFPNNLLEVMGGRGEFAITFYRDGDEIRFVDRTRSEEDENIVIWESDQGSDRCPRNLCNQISEVLRIARYFSDQGILPHDCSWELG